MVKIPSMILMTNKSISNEERKLQKEWVGAVITIAENAYGDTTSKLIKYSTDLAGKRGVVLEIQQWVGLEIGDAFYYGYVLLDEPYENRQKIMVPVDKLIKVKSPKPTFKETTAQLPVTNERIWEKLLEIEKKILELQHGS